MTQAQLKRLYSEALAADDAYHAELVRVYGAARAGDARYRRSHADARVRAALERKLRADDAWLQAMRGARSNPRKRGTPAAPALDDPAQAAEALRAAGAEYRSLARDVHQGLVGGTPSAAVLNRMAGELEGCADRVEAWGQRSNPRKRRGSRAAGRTGTAGGAANPSRRRRRFGYICKVSVPGPRGRRQALTKRFEAVSDEAAKRYCATLLRARLPAGARPVSLKRAPATRPAKKKTGARGARITRRRRSATRR